MGSGGHDTTHVERLISIGKIVQRITKLQFDWNEFVAAVWLHNLDRALKLRKEIEERGAAWAQKNQAYFDDLIHDEEDVKAFIRVRGLEIYCRELLEWSPFNEDARDRIVDAVLHHSKFADEPGDSPLLTALRIADKVDRMGPSGIRDAAAHRGQVLPPYDEQRPFGYGSTEEDRMKTLYDDLFRILEWYGMLPSEEARRVVNMEYFCFYILYVRMLGKEIADRLGIENKVEEDIKQALGQHYAEIMHELRMNCLTWATRCEEA